MATSVDILADSISERGNRITTFVCTFPRFILSELNTHRMFSRNSASSRAIPPEKIIQRVLDDPFVPIFGSRVKGMGEGWLEEGKQARARDQWMAARDDAVRHAKALLVIDVDKSRINRLLEPFMWHTAIITATEWDNFFALRDHEAAQGEFQELAHMMRVARREHAPRLVQSGHWHLPLVTVSPRGIEWGVAKKLCTSRCARVSFDKHTDTEPLEATMKRYDMLLESGHLSPFEHAAVPGVDRFYDNFFGWQSHRYEIPFQSDAGRMQQERARHDVIHSPA